MRFLPTLLLCAALAPAQAATFTTFGTGCTFNRQTLAIGNQGLPRIGTTFGITYSGPNYTQNSGQQISQPMLVLSFVLQTTVIPPNFLPQQVPNCIGLIRPDVMIPTLPDFQAQVFVVPVNIAVPNNPALMGLTVYAQWLTLFTQCGFGGCNIAALLTSDGAQLGLGN